MKIVDKLEDIEYEALPDVEKIIKDVRARGDEAVADYCAKFDAQNFTSGADFEVSEEEIKRAYEALNDAEIRHLKIAIKNVKSFAKAQFKCLRALKLNVGFSSTLGHKIIPVESVLCYAPGGNYPLPSSAIMTVIPAVVAGVKNIYLASPKIHPATIVAAHLAGASKIFKIGGVQAIAGFAYGTKSLPKVDKIVGPGNKYVTAAKKYVYGDVAIDFLAGPSEVLIVADETARPELISADILAQCEHDPDARGYLITTSEELASEVIRTAYRQLQAMYTRDISRIAFEKSSAIIVENIEDAVEISNRKAPEHLELVGASAEALRDKFTNYGSLFIGEHCAEVFGDYCSGTNHVLPTNRASRYTGGLSVFDFVKIQTYQKIDKAYAAKLSRTASAIAAQEGLFAHKLASDLRGRMVLLENFRKLLKNTRNRQTKVLEFLATTLFQYKKHTFRCKNINYPRNQQCIFAMWHAHQCGLYAFEDLRKLNVMISPSKDGDIIATATRSLGIKVVRGSQNRGGVSATLELIERLKEGENAGITIDGPRGPARIVKKGTIEIAKISGVPIVPFVWHSESKGWVKFNTWDGFRFPLLDFIQMVGLYGDPIYVPKDADDAAIEKYRKQVEDTLNELYETLQRDYKTLLKSKPELPKEPQKV